MTKTEKTALELLRDTIEIYGADRTRWPAQLRRDLAAIIGASPEAQRLIAEAAALDSLLDRAPALPQAKIDALAARIVAQSRSGPRVVAAPTPQILPSLLRPDRWTAAAAALAASLMIGLLAGQSTALGPTIGVLAGITDSTVQAGATSDQTALLSDGADTDYDEEIL